MVKKVKKKKKKVETESPGFGCAGGRILELREGQRLQPARGSRGPRAPPGVTQDSASFLVVLLEAPPLREVPGPPPSSLPGPSPALLQAHPRLPAFFSPLVFAYPRNPNLFMPMCPRVQLIPGSLLFWSLPGAA